MRHGMSGRKFNRTSSHRKAMFGNMAAALIKHEQITTTLPKAKDLRPIVEKLITLGKQGGLHARRLAYAQLRDDAMVAKLFGPIGRALQPAAPAATPACSRPASATATPRRWRSSSWSIVTWRPRAWTAARSWSTTRTKPRVDLSIPAVTQRKAALRGCLFCFRLRVFKKSVLPPGETPWSIYVRHWLSAAFAGRLCAGRQNVCAGPRRHRHANISRRRECWGAERTPINPPSDEFAAIHPGRPLFLSSRLRQRLFGLHRYRGCPPGRFQQEQNLCGRNL